jgi:phospho-N-acetylmuramoyl-pentapeptide-transferase
MGQVLIAGTASLLICVFLSPKFIEFLREREFGQNIRPEGPEGHHEKAGTPTMGGVILVTAISVPFLVLGGQKPQSLAVFGVAVACAALGFADDWTKIVKRRSLGLRARTKLIVTIVISIGLFLAATKWADKSEVLRLRLVDYQIDLGVAYIVFVYLVVAGTTSAVNLTDGLDGLAAGCMAMVTAAYVLITFWQYRNACVTAPGLGCYNVRDPLDLALVAAATAGACIGFLWWNAAPAKIFMGDTGSLALGGIIAGLSVSSRTEILAVVLGSLFVAEITSVVLQILAFRTTGRRVFRMAPFHHHFELVGWAETTVIIRFWLLTAITCGLGVALFYGEWLATIGA